MPQWQVLVSSADLFCRAFHLKWLIQKNLQAASNSGPHIKIGYSALFHTKLLYLEFNHILQCLQFTVHLETGLLLLKSDAFCKPKHTCSKSSPSSICIPSPHFVVLQLSWMPFLSGLVELEDFNATREKKKSGFWKDH